MAALHNQRGQVRDLLDLITTALILGGVPPEQFEPYYYSDLNTPSHPEMAPA